MVTIKIDGTDYQAQEGKRLLLVLEENGIRIPHVCFHHALTPAAACKLCVVEIREQDKPPVTRLSCSLKVREGLEVITESAMIQQMRSNAIGNLLKMAPRSDVIHQIGEEFGLTTGVKPDGCIRCRLCVRVCKDIIHASALKMMKIRGMNYVMPSEKGSCIGCGTCANICPTNAIRVEDKGNVRSIMIRDEIIGRHALEICDLCGTRFATTKFLEHVGELESEHPDARKSGQMCPSCAKLAARKAQRPLTPHLHMTYGGKPVK